MLCHQEPVHLPALETGFTLEDLQVLLSFLNPAVTHNSDSMGSTRSAVSVDDRKRRRMISNRESARRSRWRKTQHLTDITEQFNRFNVENRELKNRLSQIMSQYHIARKENERLRSEYIALAARLSDLYQILPNLKLL